jgi:hypothetical protein
MHKGLAGLIGTSLARSGFFFSVFLLFAAVLAWQLGGLPAEIFARMRRTAWALAICFAAVARKLAVLLHKLWVSGEVYEPLRNNHKVVSAVA